MARLTMKDEHSGMDILVLEEERLLSSKGFIDKDEMYKIMRHLAEKLFEYEELEEKLECHVGVGFKGWLEHTTSMFNTQ